MFKQPQAAAPAGTGCDTMLLCGTNKATPKPHDQTVASRYLTLSTTLSANKRSNEATPQPYKTTATGRDFDSFDNLVREYEV